MSPEDLKTRARRIVEEVLNQGDLAVANELISSGYIHHVPGGKPAPGLAGLRDWLTLTQRIFPDFYAIVEDEIAEGDRVVQRITGHGTHHGEFFGVPATGEEVTFDMIEINRVGPDGKFAEHWSSVDLLGVLQQIGAIPAPQWADASALGRSIRRRDADAEPCDRDFPRRRPPGATPRPGGATGGGRVD